MLATEVKQFEAYLGEDYWSSLPLKEPFRLHHVNDLGGELLHLKLFERTMMENTDILERN